MQTFLPYPDFARSATVLDDRRLGKQRVETLQIVRALTWPKYGWRHHPAVLMWRGYEEALGTYGVVVCEEWIGRGKADTVADKIVADLAAAGIHTPPRHQEELATLGLLPPWLGHRELHLSHRAALLRKDAEFYRRTFGALKDRPYHWPVRSADLSTFAAPDP